MGKKRKSSINTVSHDAPTVSQRLIYGSTTTHDDRATIHRGGATNAHDASTIQYGASTIQAGSVTTSHECARFSGCHATVWGGGGTLIFSSYVGLGPASSVHPQKISGMSSTPPPPKKKKNEILATTKTIPIDLKKDT